MTRKSIWIPLLCLPVLLACSDPLDVDVSDIKVDITFADVNATLISADSAELIQKHHTFGKEFTNVYAYLIGYCLKIGEVQDSAFYNSVMQYRLDPTIQKMHADIAAKFEDKTSIEAKILDGFQHIRYHLPDAHLPKYIVYMNTLFQSGVFCTEDEIGIGLQNYLGQDNRIVKQLNPEFYFDWMKEGFDARFLERDVLTGWIETHLVGETDGTLVEHIVHWGKVLYLAESAFPDEDESIILRYTQKEMDWAAENEYAFWQYLVDEDLLFKIDDRTTRNMVGDGPFTPGLPEEGSPDRMGQYLGWRMVHSYMEQNEISVKEMLDLPFNTILQDFEIE